MPKKLLATTIILATILTLVLVIQVVEVADADPFFIFHPVDPIPGTIPPCVTIVSPQNNQTYYSDRIGISFNVSKPQLGNFSTAIIEVKYTLDKDTTKAFSIWRGGSASNSWAVPEFDTIFTSPSLSIGNHQLTVVVEGVVYPGNMSIFFTYGASTVYFTMGEQTIHLSPIPSQISTPNPTQLPETTSTPDNPSTTSLLPSSTSNQPIASNYLLNHTFLATIVGVLVIMAVASISLVYFRRRNGKP